MSLFVKTGALLAWQLSQAHSRSLRQVPKGPGQGPLDYGIDHGHSWLYGSCSSRLRQSPVDIEQRIEDPPTGTMTFRYEALKDPLLIHDDNVITFPYSLGGVVHDESFYNLESAMLHTDSEHTVYGSHTLLELQLYHRRPETDAWIAVAFRLQPPPVIPVNKTILTDVESDRTLQELLQLGEAAPGFSRPMMHFVQPNRTDKWNALNFNDLFLGATFWEYQGSLTRPPCSEVVTWFVRREPVSLSPRQAQLVYSNLRRRLKQGAMTNNRELMPLGERGFKVVASEIAVPGRDITIERAPSVNDFVPVGPNPREDRTARLNGYAQAAITASTEADQESKMLDYRVQKAAYDYAQEITPELMKKVPPPVQPRFAAYEYQQKDPMVQQMKVAESMSKAVATLAANNLRSAADEIVKRARKGAYDIARVTFQEAADAHTTTLPPPWMTPPPPLKLADGTVIVFR